MAAVALVSSLAVLVALTLVERRNLTAVVLLSAAGVVAVFDLVVVVRSLWQHHWKGILAGAIGVSMIVGGPPAIHLVVNWIWAARVERLGHDLLRRSADVAGLGKLQALEGSGHDVTSHPWDIAGISGQLVLLRWGRFDSGEFPVVFSAPPRGGTVTNPAIVPGKDTLLEYTTAATTPEGQRAINRPVVHVVVNCARPIP